MQPGNSNDNPARIVQKTVVYDKWAERQALVIDGLLVLPIGAVFQLWIPGGDGNYDATVEGVRVLPGDNAVQVFLDVKIPDGWWELIDEEVEDNDE